MAISVGILEDDTDMRAYLKGVIEGADGLELCFIAKNLSEARARHKAASCDLCLVDIQLPDGSGLEFIRHARQTGPTKCLILTVLGDKTSVLQALQVGAHGYLLKDTSARQIIRDIRATMDGDAPMSPRAAAHLLRVFREDVTEAHTQGSVEANRLTERERDILGLFSRGLSYKETARVLGLSQHTVNDYVKSIYAKLDVHSKSEAVFEANAQGWL